MNNGFNGTGTAFIFYVLLAICMPVVYLYRMLRHRKPVAYRFVLQHFMTGILLTVIALLLIGLVWRKVETTAHGELHTVLLATAWMAIGTLLTWIFIPRIVRTYYRIRGHGSQLRYKNPNIHPWVDEWYIQLPQSETKILVAKRIKGVRPPKHYGMFPVIMTRRDALITVYVPLQRRLS